MQSNAAAVDPAEVNKFDALAHEFWDPRGSFKPLHALNPVRLEFVARHCVLAGSRALDVGCGGGLLAEALVGRGARVTGIDMAPAMIEVARLHALDSGTEVQYELVSAADFAATHAGGFDVVTCMELIEHVPDPAALVRALAQALRPGGMLFVSTINRNLRAFLLAIVGAEYLLRLIPPGTHEYARLVRPAELARYARAEQLELLDLAGIAFNPLTGTAHLSASTDINYLACFRREAA
jgi:2-polyprenyl-6-hydroxyphenyl methylase / 3-demethylubiquinone-9 3-methyltransferase